MPVRHRALGVLASVAIVGAWFVSPAAIQAAGAASPPAPNVPTGVTASAGDSSAVVSWTAPADNGSPITSYTVTPFIDSTAQPATTVNGTPPATVTVVSGLANGTTYSFVVSATNAAGTSDGSAPSAPAMPTAGAGYNLFGTNPPPGTADGGDPNANVELGVKFTTDVPGYVTGVRFYKYATNTGAHTGSLWSANGTRLATATFGAESASGWQQVSFSSPVPVLAGATYVASYHTTAGHYSFSGNAFVETIDKAPLHAPSNASSGGNGVFAYGGGGFPNQSYNAANYGVDVSLTTTAGTVAVPDAPTGVSASPGDSSAVVSWVAPSANGAAITSYKVTPFVAGVAQTPTTVNGSPPALSTAVSGLTNGTAYTFVVSATNSAGTGAASAPSSPVTPSAASSSYTLFGQTAPAIADGGDPNANVELGVKFTADVPGFVTGARFYKASNNTGVHTGSLWASNGTLLATATFTNETASGWQNVTFSSPVALTVGTTYIASYHTTAGHESFTANGFATGFDNSPLHAPASGVSGGNGVFAYGGSSFPNQTYNNANYWVDLTFTATALTATAPDAPTGASASATDSAAIVNWVAPAANGSAITSYTVTPFIGGAAQAPVTVTGAPPATSTIVSGLTNGTTYTFKVTATNGVGTSAASAASNPVTPSVARLRVRARSSARPRPPSPTAATRVRTSSWA